MAEQPKGKPAKKLDKSSKAVSASTAAKSRQNINGNVSALKAELTPKQQAFVAEYLIDLNLTQAAIRAGYSEKTAKAQGSRLLTNVDVAAAIAEAQAKRANKLEITQERVLKELARIAFADIRKVVKWGNTELRMVPGIDGQETLEPYHGVAVVDSELIDDDTAAAISEVGEGKFGIHVKLNDKKGALELIARHLGMLNDKVKVQGDADNPLTVLHKQISGTSFKPAE